MGLSIAISGGIILSVMLLVFMTIPGLIENFVSIGETSSKTSDLEDKILKTDTQIQELWAFSGTNVVNFDLLNEGNEKLWDYDKFNVLITYDADTGGPIPTTVTEQFTYNGTAAFDSSVLNGTADFRIQRGISIIPAGSFTTTITEGIGNDFMMCQGECFIKLVSSRNTGMGRTSGGEQQDHDEIEVYISDDSGLTTSGGTVTFQRNANPGGNENNRVLWEIWEYIGDAGGDNEMTVLDTGVCTFTSGGGDFTCNGATILGGATDDNDVEVFVTGRGNPDVTNDQVQRCLVTSSWDSGNNWPVFTRSEASNACDVSYAVIEWTGSNWAVQRITHDFTGAAFQTETITSVGEISRAFFHTQQRNADGGCCNDARAAGSEVELINPTTIEYRLPESTAGWSGNMDAVTWVISNAEIDNGEYMVVNHYSDRRLDSGSEEENWQFTITPLTYYTNGTTISGLSGQSDQGGTSYPNGYLVARLTDSTTVDFWRAETGQEDSYTFQVTEFPRIINCVSDSPGDNIEVGEWTVNYIINDNQDPQILNANECAAITAKLSNPISPNGLLIITISTDKGIISSQSQIVP